MIMKSNLITAIFCFLCIFFSKSVMSHDVTESTKHSNAQDAMMIEHTMKKLFDKPESPLQVKPISIDGVYAVAGWVQNDHGGRALLKKDHGQWSIQLCGGDGLKSSNVLVTTGMDRTTANRLSKKIAISESKLPTEVLKQLAMFDGIVKVNAQNEGSHGGTQSHTDHSNH